jgi:hypothetical protein
VLIADVQTLRQATRGKPLYVHQFLEGTSLIERLEILALEVFEQLEHPDASGLLTADDDRQKLQPRHLSRPTAPPAGNDPIAPPAVG